MKQFILIADKDPERLGVFKLGLEGPSNYLVTVSSGRDVYLKTDKQKFDLILITCDLPKMPGSDLVDKIRQGRLNAQTPVLLMTEKKEELRKQLDAKELLNAVDIFENFSNDSEILDIAKKALGGSQVKVEADPWVQIKVGPAANVSFLNPFIDSTVRVIKQMTSANEIKPGKVKLFTKTDPLPGDIFTMLPVQSPHFNGNLLLAIPKDTFLEIVFRVAGLKNDSIDQLNSDVASELGNVIFGSAKKDWNDLGYQVERMLPRTIWKQQPELFKDTKSPTLIVPFESEFGSFYDLINISVT